MPLSHRDTPCPAHFDASIDAWVLGTYADVLAALGEPALVMPGTVSAHDRAHVAVRESLTRAFTPDRLASWRVHIEADARRRIDALPVGAPVDLVRAFAEPWSLELALLVTGAERAAAAPCVPLARTLFLAAANATDGAPHAASQEAAIELSQRLASAETLGDASATVQAFVALTQTLPALLAGAWFELLQDPALQAFLHAHLREHSRLPPRAVSELLRVAGPSRAVFREARADADIGTSRVPAGDRVVLMLGSANHDPARFAEPVRVNCAREHIGHLAFGAGPHACAGAGLVREALDVATSALLRGTSAIALGSAAPVKWIGGFAIRAPGDLPVVVSRLTDPHESAPRYG